MNHPLPVPTEGTDNRKDGNSWLPAAPFCAAASMLHPRRAGAMVKMNLPPLMGRRDAAYDAASELITGKLFPEDVPHGIRVSVYDPLLKLLDTVENDTKALLAMLASPDTEARERRLLAYITMLKSAVQALRSFAELEAWGFGTDREAEGTGSAGDALSSGEEPLRETERSIINQLKSFFERSRERILRYRGYAGKNFSSANAGRYTCAYQAYFVIYHQNNQDNTEIL